MDCGVLFLSPCVRAKALHFGSYNQALFVTPLHKWAWNNQRLGNDLYVDVLATWTETEDKAIRLYISAREVNMSRGRFNVCKWKRTTSRVRQYIQNCENCDGVAGRNKDEMAAECLIKETVTEDDASHAKVLVNPLNANEVCEMKVLGNSWNFENDTLRYSI